MTPAEFKKKWAKYTGKESSAYQEHFNDLCHLLQQPTPAEADSSGADFFCFQKGVVKDAERPAWLDLAHKKPDAATVAAYGWPADLTDEQILEKLLALNLERAAEEAKQAVGKRREKTTREKQADEMI